MIHVLKEGDVVGLDHDVHVALALHGAYNILHVSYRISVRVRGGRVLVGRVVKPSLRLGDGGHVGLRNG